MALPNRCQVQAVLLMCACCFWCYIWACAAAGTQHADCKLVLVGGDTSGSFSEVTLECSSEAGTPVDIAIGPQLTEFSKGFKGVRFRNVLQCQDRSEAETFGPRSPQNRPALISFCGDYSVNFEQPIVKNIKAGFGPDSGNAVYSSLLLFGGKVRASISAGAFEGNTEIATVLYLMGTAQVAVQAGTICRSNSGRMGTCAVTFDRSRLTITKSALQNNSALTAGAVFSGGASSVVIRDSQLTGNIVTATDDIADGGACVAERNSTMQLINTLVASNSAGYSGGGAAAWHQASLHIINCNVTGNRAPAAGGVRSRNEASVVIKDSQLTGNVATATETSTESADGGACLATGKSTMQLINTLLSSNSAGSSGGGAAAWDKASLRITNCNVTDNRAPTGAGGVASWGKSFVVIRGSQLTSNNVTSAVIGGGGACLAAQNSTMQLINTLVASNIAGWSGGGAAAWDKASLHINNCNVTGNKAPSAGGVISYNEALVVIKDSQLTGNVATATDESNLISAAGGACVASGSSTMKLINTLVASNVAVYVGGGVAAVSQASLHMTNSNVTGNKAPAAGGVISFNEASVVIKDSQLIGNVATSTDESNLISADGGACLATENSTMKLINTLVASNIAGHDGGGTATWNQASLHITNCNVTGNTAHSGGGVASWDNSSVIIRDSQLTGNNATYEDSVGGGCVAIKKSRMQLVNTLLASNYARYAGGGALVGEQARLHITNCSVKSNTAGEAGGVLARMSASLTVQGSLQLLDNTATAGDGGGLAVQDSAVVHIDTEPGSLCAGNSAQYGGCAFIDSNATVNVTGAINITGNTAYRNGGGIYAFGRLFWPLGSNRDKLNKFVYGNRANEYGGGVHLLLETPDVLAIAASTFNNTAQYDSNLSVLATNMGFTRPNVTTTNATNFGSGTKLASTTPNNIAAASSVVALNVSGAVSVQLYVWGMHGWPCEGIGVQAMLTEQGLLASNTSGRGGLVTFNLHLPIGNHNITFSTTGDNPVSPVTGNFVISGCAKGQVVKPGGVCQDCPAGSYSQNPTETNCTACPGNAECYGGAAILPREGFWHSSVGSPEIHECPNPQACIGHEEALRQCSNPSGAAACDAAIANSNKSSYSDLRCSDGYTGNVCGVCAEGFGSVGPFTCRKCRESKALILALYICGALVLLGFMLMVCHFTHKENNQMQQKLQQQQQQQQQILLPFTTSASVGAVETEPADVAAVIAQAGANSNSSTTAVDSNSKMLATDLLKPTVIYMQYLLIVASLAGVKWPTPLLLSFKALAWVWSSASAETATIECLFASSGLPAPYLKTLLYLFAPIGMLLALLFVQWASMWVACWRKQSAMPSCWQCGGGDGRVSSNNGWLATSCVVVVLFSLPVVVRTTLSLFACIPLGGVSVWSQHTNTVCYTGYHKKFALGLGLPLVLLVCIALPTWVVLLTLRARCKHDLTEPGFSSRFGSLVRPYRVTYCWWEGVVICQTIMLVAISVFAHTVGAFNQAIVLNAGIASVLLLLIVFHPLAHKEANHVMQHAMCCLLLTSYAALTFLPTGGTVHANNVYNGIMGSFVLIVNLVFVGSVAWRFARLVEWTGVVNTMFSCITSLYANVQAAMPIKKHYSGVV